MSKYITRFLRCNFLLGPVVVREEVNDHRNMVKKSADNVNQPPSSSFSKTERKVLEKNRRIRMKGLCMQLASLLPPQRYTTSKELLSQQDQFDHAASYIKQLKERVEALNQRKEELMRSKGYNISNNRKKNDHMSLWSASSSSSGYTRPVLNITDMNSDLEVSVISGRQRNFTLHEMIGILEEEGASVVGASLSTLGDKVFHTLHAQAKISRVGIETSIISQRLRALIYQ